MSMYIQIICRIKYTTVRLFFAIFPSLNPFPPETRLHSIKTARNRVHFRASLVSYFVTIRTVYIFYGHNFFVPQAGHILLYVLMLGRFHRDLLQCQQSGALKYDCLREFSIARLQKHLHHRQCWSRYNTFSFFKKTNHLLYSSVLFSDHTLMSF